MQTRAAAAAARELARLRLETLSDDVHMLIARYLCVIDLLSLSESCKLLRASFGRSGLDQLNRVLVQYPEGLCGIWTLVINKPRADTEITWTKHYQTQKPWIYNMIRYFKEERSLLYELTRAAMTPLGHTFWPRIETVKTNEFRLTKDIEGPPVPEGGMRLDSKEISLFDPYVKDMIESWKICPHLWSELTAFDSHTHQNSADTLGSAEIFKAMPLVPSLQELKLTGCVDDGESSLALANALGSLPELTVLNLCGNTTLSDVGFLPFVEALKEPNVCNNLVELNIGHTLVTSKMKAALANVLAERELDDFRYLNLYSCPFLSVPGVDDDAVDALINLVENGMCLDCDIDGEYHGVLKIGGMSLSGYNLGRLLATADNEHVDLQYSLDESYGHPAVVPEVDHGSDSDDSHSNYDSSLDEYVEPEYDSD